METAALYFSSLKKQLLYYKTIGEKAMLQLEPEQLFITTNEDSNSIATIVKHISGNMISRWTDFLTTDGEKEWRNREAEFENDLTTPGALFAIWNKGWDCFFDAIDSLKPEDLGKIIYIRNEGQTALDAINRQLAHYPYHIGQIVFYAKQLKNASWDSLSIPRNNSNTYNSEKFAQDKTVKHFTDDELEKLK
ncbi:MAG: DUF1572 family protein [Flavobacterium sp.]